MYLAFVLKQIDVSFRSNGEGAHVLDWRAW